MMNQRETSWYVNVIGNGSQPPIPDKDFATLDDALSFVAGFFEEPGSDHIDNAQCSISDGKINFLYLNCLMCKLRKQHEHVDRTFIASKEAYNEWNAQAARQMPLH